MAEGVHVVARESELIERILAGESELFEDLIRPHVAALRAFVRHSLRNETDADDVLQEVLTKAYTKLYQFRGLSQFSSWLGAIAFNEIRQYRRRYPAHYWASVECGGEQFAANDPHPLALLERDSMRKAVNETLSRLPSPMRESLLLCYIREQSLTDAAKGIGVAESAMKTRVFRAKKKMLTMWVARYGTWGSKNQRTSKEESHLRNTTRAVA
jgi:RNA polymerase sigma-70 factor (ECF subfamily)